MEGGLKSGIIHQYEIHLCKYRCPDVDHMWNSQIIGDDCVVRICDDICQKDGIDCKEKTLLVQSKQFFSETALNTLCWIYEKFEDRISSWIRNYKFLQG